MLQILSYSELLWFQQQGKREITKKTLSLFLIRLYQTKSKVHFTTLNSLRHNNQLRRVSCWPDLQQIKPSHKKQIILPLVE